MYEDRRVIFAFPTNDELFAVFVGWPIDEVGDAGCQKDQFRALGRCDAFRDAELLAEALEAPCPACGPRRRR